MADAQASGACGGNIVWVQVPSPASFFVLIISAFIPPAPGFAQGPGVLLIKRITYTPCQFLPGQSHSIAIISEADSGQY